MSPFSPYNISTHKCLTTDLDGVPFLPVSFDLYLLGGRYAFNPLCPSILLEQICGRSLATLTCYTVVLLVLLCTINQIYVRFEVWVFFSLAHLWSGGSTTCRFLHSQAFADQRSHSVTSRLPLRFTTWFYTPAVHRFCPPPLSQPSSFMVNLAAHRYLSSIDKHTDQLPPGFRKCRPHSDHISWRGLRFHAH